MKTIFAFVFAMIMVLQGYAYSNNDQLNQLSGVSYSYQKVKVTLLEGAGKVKITVLDENGVKIYGDLVEVRDNIVYPFDMSQLPNGKYTIRITNKEGKVEHPVEIKSRQR